jgi:FPC/CPF motif-containing protein YcgG
MEEIVFQSREMQTSDSRRKNLSRQIRDRQKEYAQEEIRSQSSDLSAWTNIHWIQRNVHEV